jgi:CheY-like chemotaxis protein
VAHAPAPGLHAPFTVLPPPLPSHRTEPAAASTKPVSGGMTATLTAPLKETKSTAPASDSPVISAVPADIAVKNPKGNRELILFIEDEVEVAEIAADMLADEGYKVIVVNDGLQALKIYERIGKQIRLVILDFFLPILDGDAVFEELRAINPNVDVVLSSGFAEQSKISAMLAQGLRGFIPKPYTSERLLSQVRTILDAGRRS